MRRQRFEVRELGYRFVEGDSALVVFCRGAFEWVFCDWLKWVRGRHPATQAEFEAAAWEYLDQVTAP